MWHDDAEDGGALELAFSKKKIEERKAWLAAVEPGTFLDQSQVRRRGGEKEREKNERRRRKKTHLDKIKIHTKFQNLQPEIGYSDFVHRELVLFSRADLER